MSFDATDYTSAEIEEHIRELEERIAKAREILQSDEYADHDSQSEVQRALAALEGK